MVQKFTFWRTQMDAGMKPAAEIGETFYLAADVDARIAELEKALRWAIENGVARNYVNGGLYSLIDDVQIEPPSDIAGVLSSLMER